MNNIDMIFQEEEKTDYGYTKLEQEKGINQKLQHEDRRFENKIKEEYKSSLKRKKNTYKFFMKVFRFSLNKM